MFDRGGVNGYLIPAMNAKVKVELGNRSYEISIGQNLLSSVGELCSALGLKGQALLVTDSNVGPLYAEDCRDSLADADCDSKLAVLPAGETTKCELRLFELYDHALDHKMTRASFVVALGGGVVGDIAGYLAASYLRGIAFIQIPTSLLAMVDSSVGGKTGINLPRGKNLVGAFHQPRAVLSDIDVLQTLPKREWRAGLAEVVKYGAISDSSFFDYMEANLDRILNAEPQSVIEIVRRSCLIKADVVRRDECESGLRAILNFGHTLGHAIENLAGYGEYLHGEAVSIGMAYAALLSTRIAGMAGSDCQRIIGMLERIGLPVRPKESLNWEQLEDIMHRDKKAHGGAPLFVLTQELGCAQPGYLCDAELCREVWHELCE